MAEDGEDFLTLVCSHGAADAAISEGDVSYPAWRENLHDPHSRFLVRVPRAAAQRFCHNAGFYVLKN